MFETQTLVGQALCWEAAAAAKEEAEIAAAQEAPRRSEWMSRAHHDSCHGHGDQ